MPAQPKTITAAIAVAALGVALAGCGRSAPVDPLATAEGDPEIAGVSITSPDAVVAVDPTTAPAEEVAAPTSESVVQAAATYVVEPGDTLSGIAGQFGVTITALADANGITDVHSITPGEELIIPAVEVVEVEVVEVDAVDTESTTTTAQP